MVGGRGTRFCFPPMKMVMYFSFRSRRARFSAAVSFRFGLGIGKLFQQFAIDFVLFEITLE